MTDIHFTKNHTFIVAPACQQCGSTTRLYGIEPHLSFPRTDIQTFACMSCDGVEVVHVPLPLLAQPVQV